VPACRDDETGTAFYGWISGWLEPLGVKPDGSRRSGGLQHRHRDDQSYSGFSAWMIHRRKLLSRPKVFVGNRPHPKPNSAKDAIMATDLAF
jgi:hypothetical protein